MPNIVPSLFGMNPEQVRQARNSDIQTGANNFAQMNPMQQAQSMLYQGGAGLGQAGAGMLGFKDPMMEQAKSRQQIGSQMDMNTPEGYYVAAKQAQDRGDFELASNLVATGREMEGQMAKQQFMAAQTAQQGKGYEVTEIGVEGRPNWKQKVMLFKDGTTKNIGAPYKTRDDSEGAKANKARPKEMSSLRALDDQVFNLQKASEEIKTHPGLGGATGLMAGISSVPGGEAKKVENLLEEFKANVKQAGLQLVRAGGSIGQITEREWNIVEGMVAAIDPAAGKEAVRSQIDKVNAKIAQVYENAKMAYSEEYGEEYEPKKREVTTITIAPPTAGVISLDDLFKANGVK